MRVCKHGCGVKMLCFSRSNHASTNLKKFSSSKLDKFTLGTGHYLCGGGGGGGEKSLGGPGLFFFLEKRDGPKENFTIIGGGLLCVL